MASLNIDETIRSLLSVCHISYNIYKVAGGPLLIESGQIDYSEARVAFEVRFVINYMVLVMVRSLEWYKGR